MSLGPSTSRCAKMDVGHMTAGWNSRGPHGIRLAITERRWTSRAVTPDGGTEMKHLLEPLHRTLRPGRRSIERSAFSRAGSVARPLRCCWWCNAYSIARSPPHECPSRTKLLLSSWSA